MFLISSYLLYFNGFGGTGIWLRGRDLNPGPQGYEPCELPDCSTPRHRCVGIVFLPCAFTVVKVGTLHGRKIFQSVVDGGYYCRACGRHYRSDRKKKPALRLGTPRRICRLW